MTMFTRRCSRQLITWRTEFASGFKIFLTLLLLSSFFNPAKVSAQCTACTSATGPIIIDGNPCDWNLNNLATFPIHTYVLDAFGNGVNDTSFTQGSKDFFEASDLRWEFGQTKAKNDIANGAAVLSGTTLFFAGDRTTNNGDAQIGFWFYLNGTHPVVETDGTQDFSPNHAVGDILVLADFTGGGLNATVTVYQWVGTGGNVPNTNGTLNTTNCTGIVAENNSGAVPVPNGWTFTSLCYAQNEFYEGQIDLSCVLNSGTPNVCFSSFLLETRSSQSITASLDDFVDGAFGAKPSPDFTANTVCLGTATTFTNTTPQATSYSWNFGDGGTSTATNPTHTYATAGTFTVTLTATGATGCTTSVSHTVTVNPAPTAAFTASTECLGSATTFTNTSTGATSYSWNFGDGGTSTATNPTHTYAAAGTYTVTLTATSGSGCTASVSHTVTVNPNPTAAFSANTVCLGTATTFTNTSTGATSYSWNFGDGGTSTATNPTHTYATAGTFTVTLTATSGSNCTSSVSHVVTVNPNPTAEFSATSPCLGTATSFTNTSTGATSYSWNFGDGGTSTATSPTHTYATAGTFTVTLTATSSAGCTASVSHTVTVNPIPVAAFSANSVCLGTATTFTNTSTGATSYSWNFGDGGTSTATSPTHTYAAVGTYTVTLTATSAAGCTASVSHTVTVTANPTANAGNDQTQCRNASGTNTFGTNTFTLTGSGTGGTCSWALAPSGNPQGYTVVINSPSSCTTTVDISGAAVNGGTVTLRLSVTSASCGTATDDVILTLNALPLVKTLTSTNFCPNVATGGTVTLQNSQVGVSYQLQVDGTNTADAPKLGTGGDLTWFNEPAGTYTVVGTILATSCNTTSGPTDVVENSVPAPAFSANTVCLGTATTFTNTSTGASSYSWNFGDGGTSTATNPTHTYAAAGTYTVTLTATFSDGGCTASISHTVTVNPNPTAAFSANTVCLGTATTFTNTSTGATSYSWNFGDGGTSTATNPTHTYATSGTFTVTLTATSAGGCTASVSHTVTVNPNPTAAFSANSVCLGTATSFTNTSTGATSYSWNFGDGGTSTATNPTHTYAAAGTYTVTLTATSDGGCTASVSHTVTVNANPTADFTANTVCLGTATNFTNTSTGATTYSWNFGDGGTSTETNPSHTYAAAGTFTVTLTATSAAGCTASVSHTVTVNPCGVTCTYTQGYYGNPGGISCNGQSTGPNQFTTVETITNSLNAWGGSLTVGCAGHSVTITTADISCLISVLPGGGAPKALPAGDFNICNLSSAGLLKNGKINNSLLAQTITLGLNMGINSSLSTFALQANKWLVTADVVACGSTTIKDCQFSCTPDGLGGFIWTVTYTPYHVGCRISQALYDALSTKDVAGLYALANSALCGTALPTGVSYSDISNAEDCINNAFDGCKSFITWASGDVAPTANSFCSLPSSSTPCPTVTSARPASESVASTDKLKVTAYPNPFTNMVKFTLQSNISGQATLEVYNAVGQKVSTVYNGYLQANRGQVVEYRAQRLGSNLIYILRVGNQQVTGKLLHLE
jgi:PKD repeat protein